MHFHHAHDATPCTRDHGWPDYVHALFTTLDRGVTTMTEAQSHLDADVQALTAAIAAEVDALKAQPAADGLDFSGLDALVTQVQSAVPAPIEDPGPTPADPNAPAADPSAPAAPAADSSAPAADPNAPIQPSI